MYFRLRELIDNNKKQIVGMKSWVQIKLEVLIYSVVYILSSFITREFPVSNFVYCTLSLFNPISLGHSVEKADDSLNIQSSVGVDYIFH